MTGHLLGAAGAIEAAVCKAIEAKAVPQRSITKSLTLIVTWIMYQMNRGSRSRCSDE